MVKHFRRSVSIVCLQDFFFRWCRSFSIEEDERKNDDCSVWIAPSAYCALRSYERDGGKE